MLDFALDRNKTADEKVTPIHPSTHQWSTPLQTVLDQPPSTLPSQLAVGGLAFTVAFSSWAWLGRVNEVSHAQGKLVPEGNPYKVHSVESGKVSQLMVKEGQTVKTGQVLAKLDTTLAEKEVEQLEKRLSDSQAELSKMESMLELSQLEAQSRQEMARSALRAQEVELAQAQDTIGINQALLADFKTDVSEQMKRLNRLKPLRRSGAIAAEQVFMVEQAVRERNRALLESQGNLQKAHSETQRLTELIIQQKADAQRIAQESQQQIQNIQLKIAGLNANINEAKISLERARAKLNQGYVHASADGVVSNLGVNNIGEVIQPGHAIAEILPADKPLILSTVVPAQEAGLIKSGMRVQIKLDAYPHQDYGVITGRVMSISPDSQTDPQLGQVYRARVKLDRNYVTKDGQKVFFKAGQTANAEIVTRDRRIVDVLLDPIKQIQNDVNL
jgi:hemolysin D